MKSRLHLSSHAFGEQLCQDRLLYTNPGSREMNLMVRGVVCYSQTRLVFYVQASLTVPPVDAGCRVPPSVSRPVIYRRSPTPLLPAGQAETRPGEWVLLRVRVTPDSTSVVSCVHLQPQSCVSRQRQSFTTSNILYVRRPAAIYTHFQYRRPLAV